MSTHNYKVLMSTNCSEAIHMYSIVYLNFLKYSPSLILDQDPFREFATAGDWYNPRHYKPNDGAGLFLVHWRTCPFCRDAIDDPVFFFFTYRPLVSIQELCEFARLWPLLIADMMSKNEPIGPI